jgi:hypothetical protein
LRGHLGYAAGRGDQHTGIDKRELSSAALLGLASPLGNLVLNFSPRQQRLARCHDPLSDLQQPLA